MKEKKYLISGHKISEIPVLASKLFSHIRQAINGKEYDYTSGSLNKAIFLLSIPMILEMLMESIFAIVDIFFVSRLGADAIAAVGLTESLVHLIYPVAAGLAMVTTALVARRIGEKNNREASETAWQAILTAIFASVLIGLPGFIYAEDILRLMGASETIIIQHSGYTRIMLGFNVVIMLLYVINAVFRAAGDAAFSMRTLMLANGLNIILDPLLIFGFGPIPALGIEGAALATNIGRGTAVIYQLYMLFAGRGRINLPGISKLPDWKLILKILRMSVGGIGQAVITTSSWLALVRIIASFGSEVVAGYTIGLRIIVFTLLPSLGISNAAATLVGQNLGADKPDRAEKSVWTTGKINAVIMGTICIFFIAVPDFWIRIFSSDPAVIHYGAEFLRIISYGFAAYGVGMVLVNSFNGAGDTKTPTYINILCFWMIEIPLAIVLSQWTELKYQGVFYSIIIAEIIMTSISAFIFKKGKWKTVKA